VITRERGGGPAEIASCTTIWRDGLPALWVDTERREIRDANGAVRARFDHRRKWVFDVSLSPNQVIGSSSENRLWSMQDGHRTVVARVRRPPFGAVTRVLAAGDRHEIARIVSAGNRRVSTLQVANPRTWDDTYAVIIREPLDSHLAALVLTRAILDAGYRHLPIEVGGG